MADSTDSKTDRENETNDDAPVKEIDTSAPVSDMAAIVDIKGIVNSYEDVINQKATFGIGTIRLFNGGKEDIYQAQQVVANYKSEKGEYTIVSAYSELEKVVDLPDNIASAASYHLFTLYLKNSEMLKMKEMGISVVGNEVFGGAIDSRIEYYRRKDNVLLLKKCNKLAAMVVEKNAFMVDVENSETFAVGENFSTKANIVMSDDFERLKTVSPSMVEDNGEICRFSVDRKDVDKETFYLELQEAFGLDCEIGEDFLTPFSEEYLTFMLKGEIVVPTGTGSEKTAGGEVNLFLGGKNVEVSNFNKFAVIREREDGDVVSISSMGNYRNLGENHLALEVLEIDFGKSAFLEMKKNGENSVAFETIRKFGIFHYEYKEENGQGKTKSCPIGVLLGKTPQNSIFLCHENNVAFEVGETLQVAANLAVSSDPAIIAEAAGDEKECYCHKGNQEIDCGEF